MVNRRHKGKSYRIRTRKMFGKTSYIVELVKGGVELAVRMSRKAAEEVAKVMGLRKARSRPAAARNPKRKSMRLGSGGRFKACVTSVKKSSKRRVSSAGAKAICASAGRKKYGAKRMAKMAAAGRKRAARSNPVRRRSKAVKRPVKKAVERRTVALKPGTGKHWLTDRLGRPIGSRTGYPSLATAKSGAELIRRRSSKIIKVFRGPKSYMQSHVWGGNYTAKAA